jgi:hypothetical protein
MLDFEKQGVQMQTVGKPGCGLSRLAPTIAVSMATSSRAKVSGAIRRNPHGDWRFGTPCDCLRRRAGCR